MRCEDLVDDLPGVVDGDLKLDRAGRRHVETCLACQAELARYRKLLRTLHSLRVDGLEPTPGSLAEVLAAVAEAGERHAARSLITGRRAAYLGGIAAAATAAGAAGALVLASRSRRGRLPLAG